MFFNPIVPLYHYKSIALTLIPSPLECLEQDFHSPLVVLPQVRSPLVALVGDSGALVDQVNSRLLAFFT